MNNNLNTDNGTNLRELFMVLWKHKMMIISITLIAAIISGIISMFFIPSVYQSNLNIVINMPDTLVTKYGEYTLPITTNDQYIRQITSNNILENTIKDMGYNSDNVKTDKLKEKIEIDTSAISYQSGEQNNYTVRISAKNATEAQKLAQTLYENYIEYLNVMIIENAANYYYNNLRIQLNSDLDALELAKKVLTQNETILLNIPKTIDQKGAMKEIEDMANTSDFVVINDVVNPNYTEVEKNIIQNKQDVNTLQNSVDTNTIYIEKLQDLKDKVSEYYSTGKYIDEANDLGNIINANVFIPSKPAVPSEKTSPSNTTNVIIGAFLGCVVVIGITLFREYWFGVTVKKD